MDTVIYEVGAAAAYGLVGLALMALGYLVVSVLAGLVAAAAGVALAAALGPRRARS